ncbi:MAG: nickel-dependent hydrogenase large subunit [Candidatus Bathyarchaeia archaeon]
MVEIQLGPISPTLLEPIAVKVSVLNGKIIDVNLKADYVYRKIEDLARGRNVFSLLPLVERVCGICSFAHITPYCQAVEHICSFEISEYAKLTRVILAELERIQSHLLYLFEVATHIRERYSYSIKILKIREEILKLLEKIGGKRIHSGMNIIGGVRCNINTKMKRIIREKLDIITPKIKKLWEIEHNLSKKEGIGVLSREMAKSIAVGPTARASGVDFDVRRDMPYAAYDKLDLDVKVRTEGDVKARACLHLEETLESINLIRRALDFLPNFNEKFVLPRIVSGEAKSYVEAPRGKNEYYVRLNESGNIEKLEIKTPTYHNINIMRDILLGQNIEDLEIILVSIDPCLSCACRVFSGSK